MNNQYNIILERIENEIKDFLPKNVTKDWIFNAVGKIDTNISIESVNNINLPALELINRGGKRWRPLVLVLTAYAYNGDVESALKLAPLVELVHNGTLLIDDIEDNAEERRGDKAVHLIYGEDMAINSGNHLYYYPTTILDNLTTTAEQLLKLYKSYAHNMRRLHFGQGMDIQWHRNIEFIPTVEEYIQMCKFKTGCLASMSGEIGAILSNLSDYKIEAIRVLWENIGVGFQIIDDIKNITTGNPGKLRGDDIVEGKKSLPVILYCNNKDNDKNKLLENIKNAKLLGIQKGNSFVENAIELLDKSNSIKEAKIHALNMIDKSIVALEELLPKSEYKEMILNLVKGFLKNTI